MSGRRIKGYKYMVIKNQTKMKKEHIQAVMRAANFDNDRYKKFKLMYNFFGLLFGMMFVRYLIFEMLGSSERQPVMMVLYGIVGAVFLYIGMYGMDKDVYKRQGVTNSVYIAGLNNQSAIPPALKMPAERGVV